MSAVRFRLGKLVMFVQDLPTEAAHAVGMLKKGLALRAGRSIEHLAYRLADHVVVISRAFATYIQGAGVAPAKISEIPNWADVESIKPGRPDQEMRRRLGAGPDDFLVVHTGNMGAKQDLLNVVGAAAVLRSDQHIKFALIGDGQERSRIAERIASEQLDNIKVLPLQASNEFPTVLIAANALLINQAPLVIDSVLPSKLLAYMASGRAVLVAAHTDSTTADVVRRAGCGIVAEPGQPGALASGVRAMASRYSASDSLDSMGRRGRTYVEQHFDRQSMLNLWTDLITRLWTAPGS
jgi:colanic acid biosynthesis glycosyl transferase WcaI